jgi:hypothetical protein
LLALVALLAETFTMGRIGIAEARCIVAATSAAVTGKADIAKRNMAIAPPFRAPRELMLATYVAPAAVEL